MTAPARPRLGVLSSALRRLTPAEVCATASSLGLAGVEWALGDDDGSGVGTGLRAGDRLRRLATEAGIEVCGLAVQDAGLMRDGRDLVRHAQFAAAAGAPHLRVFAPPYGGRDVDSELRQLAARLCAGAQAAEQLGVALLVEMSPGTIVPGPEWFARLATLADPSSIGAVYDPGSMMIEGHVAPLLAVATLERRLMHVHVKDVAPCREGATRQWTHVPPGRGMVPWVEVVEALTRAGYGGWCVIDHTGGEPTPQQLQQDLVAFQALAEPAAAARR